MEDDTVNLSFDEEADPEADKRFLEDLYSKKSYVRDEMRIVLIGKTGSGKSATGNLLIGEKTFESKSGATSVTKYCQDLQFERFGRPIQLVDTPGLFDTRAPRSHVDKEMKTCVLKTSPGIHAVLMVCRVGRFTDDERDTVEYFKKKFGEGLLNYMMIVFTRKDDFDEDGDTIENYVRTAPPDLQKLVADCGGRCLAINNRASKEEKEAQAKQLISNIDQMVTANGGKCYTTAMFRKAEAMMKKREEEARKKLEEEKKAEREAIENSIKEKYDGVMEEQEKKMKNLKADMEEIQREGKADQLKHQQALAGLESQLKRAEKEKKKIEEDRKKWEEERRKEMEKKEEERNQAMLMMMDRMQEENRAREEVMEERMKKVDEERKQMEAEMRQREKEREQREKRYQEQMMQLAKEKQKEFAEMRKEQSKTMEMFARKMDEQARQIARAKNRGGPCTIL